MRDYYSILNISKKATITDIKKAYQLLSENCRSKNNCKFNNAQKNNLYKEAKEAYEVLSNEHSRKLYDENMELKLKNIESNIGNKSSKCEVFHDNRIKNASRSSESRIALFDNRRNAFPSQMFNTISKEFNDMINFSEEMMKLSEAVFKMPTISFTSKKDDKIIKESYYKNITAHTTIIDGKRKTVVIMNENGKETIITYEDDIMVSKVVDGVPQTIQKIK